MRRVCFVLCLVVGCSGNEADRPKQQPHEASGAAPEASKDSPKPAGVEPVSASRKPSAPDRFGASWRLSNARFQDLLGGYGIEAPRGWTLRVGEDVPAFGVPWPGTVGFVADGTSIEAVMTRRPVPSPDGVGVREELEAAGIPILAESTVRVDGLEHTSVVWSGNDGREHQSAKWCDNHICTRVEFAYPFQTPDARDTSRRADFVFETLSAAEQQELRDALVAHGLTRRETNGDLVLAGLRLTDRGNGMSFTLPDDGPWEIHLGDAARQRTNQRWILGRFAQFETGLVFKYAAHPVAGLTSNEDYHQQVLAALTLQFGASVRTPKPRSTRIGSLPALESEFDMTGLRARLVTATIDDRVIQFTITHDMLAADEQRKLIDQFIESVEGDGKLTRQAG